MCPTLSSRPCSRYTVSCVVLNHLMMKTARGIIDKLFFSDKRYDLGEVGRYKINEKLGMETSWIPRS